MPSSIKPPPPPEAETPAAAAPAAPKEPKEPRERSGRGVLIGIGVAVVIAAVVGYLAGDPGDSGESAGGKPTAAATSADVEALFPKGWTKAAGAPEIPGTTFSEPVAMKPPEAKGGQSVVFGQVKEGAANPTLLSAGFLEALGLDPGEVPPREAVQLSRSKLQAYRYPNLRPNGLDDAVTIFTVPTSAGIATLACVDPGADCEAIANTLKLNAGTAFAVGPSKDYAADVGGVLGGLNKQIKSGRADMRSAKTPKAQAAATARVASAYNGASKAVAGLEVSPADATNNTQLAASLKETGAAYGKLAAAVRSGNKSRYEKAKTPVQQGEQAVTGALGGLEAAGYKVAT